MARTARRAPVVRRYDTGKGGNPSVIGGGVRRLSLLWANLPLRAKGIIVVLIPLVALLGAMTSSYKNETKQQQAESWVRHSEDIRVNIQEALLLLLKAEAGVQGYRLTGEVTYLDSFLWARDALPDDLANLARLVRDSPDQIDRMLRIRNLAELQMEHLAALIWMGSPRASISPATRDEFLAEAKVTRDALQIEFASMQQEEDRLLAMRTARAAAVHRRSVQALAVSVVGGITCGVLAILLFVGGIGRRVKLLEENANQLARMVPLTSLPPGNDEIGRLGQALSESGTLLFEREKQLQETSAEAERANRAKSEFLSRMSHELRTPLNAVIGFSELLLEHVVGDLTAKQDEFVRDIRDSGKHLLLLINDILDISKIEAERMELIYESSDLVDVVDAALDPLQSLIERKHHQVTTNLDPAASTVWADPSRLKQILFNLLSNAVKFTPLGGQIRLESRRVSGEVELTVADNGPGIPLEQRAQLFQVFSQLAEDQAVQSTGTGLGLALVKRLVELHGGRVWVESEVGVGSRFIVRLPLKTSEEPGQDDVAPVLVVEDDFATQRLFTHYLREAGYRTVSVGDGQDLVDKVKALHPSVICLDIKLPGLADWEVLERLKADPETAPIPIVVTTVIDDHKRAAELGATSYLVKPIRRESLLDAVGSAMRTLTPGAGTVLVADDDPSVLTIIRPMLEAHGYKVLTAVDGKETLLKVREQLPDLIILDLVLPDFTGFEVIAALRGEERTRGIPILILTAKDLTPQEQAFLAPRVQDIKLKGTIPPRDLVAEVGRILAATGAHQ